MAFARYPESYRSDVESFLTVLDGEGEDGLAAVVGKGTHIDIGPVKVRIGRTAIGAILYYKLRDNKKKYERSWLQIWKLLNEAVQRDLRALLNHIRIILLGLLQRQVGEKLYTLKGAKFNLHLKIVPE